jgi:hypothetical protein
VGKVSFLSAFDNSIAAIMQSAYIKLSTYICGVYSIGTIVFLYFGVLTSNCYWLSSNDRASAYLYIFISSSHFSFWKSVIFCFCIISLSFVTRHVGRYKQTFSWYCELLHDTDCKVLTTCILCS